MRKLLLIVVAALLLFAPAAAAEPGPSPVHDQMCYTLAYARGEHMQGGVLIDHDAHCKDAKPPWDY